MSGPWNLRDPEAPSDLLVDAYVAGEATAEERARVEAWCARDPALRAAIEVRRRGFAALPGARPDAMLRNIERALAPAPRRRRFGWRGVTTLGALAAAAVALWFGRAPAVDAPLGGGVRAKGSLGLRVFRDRGGRVSEALPGERFEAGDRLRFRPEGLPDAGQVMVVGMEAGGALFAYAPAGGRRSVPVSQRDAEGALPGAAELDASRGREWANLVWCPEAFGLEDLRAEGPGRLQPPAGCRVSAFEVDKP
jgi:hypothetical protein